MKVNHKQLTLAREYRGYTQTVLSSKINGLSQSNLSKYEKGIGTLSEELVDKIMDFLDFPKDFLCIEIYNKVEEVHFRKKVATSRKDKNTIEHSIKLVGYLIDAMATSVSYPEFNIRRIDLEEGFTPKSAAKYTRKFFSLNDKPVKNICKLLEKEGIIIVELNNLTSTFDGVSFYTDKGFPTIIINNNMSNDRKRFTLAHELGHIIMHLDYPISDYRNPEDEAFKFAAEFLMPENEIKNQLINLKISDLSSLKGFWLTSMASIIRRAKDLNCIDENRYKYFNIELSRHGYRRKEPFDVSIDEPTIFKTSYNIHRNELDYSLEDLSKAFHLPEDIIVNFFVRKTGNNYSKIIPIKI